jgi:hypothetical protein
MGHRRIAETHSVTTQTAAADRKLNTKIAQQQQRQNATADQQRPAVHAIDADQVGKKQRHRHGLPTPPPTTSPRSSQAGLTTKPATLRSGHTHNGIARPTPTTQAGPCH